MPRRSHVPRLQHSLWDRLIDPSLHRGEDVDTTPASEIQRIKEEVRRDLEWLLNSRSTNIEIPAGLDALQRSLVRYGLPDFSSLNLSNTKARERFQSVLETVIRDFEPRLDRVEVRLSLLEQDHARPSVHYMVEAVLKLEPTPQSVVFDTVLELGTKKFRVQ
jgi:type VI secretion system protein ImpF